MIARYTLSIFINIRKRIATQIARPTIVRDARPRPHRIEDVQGADDVASVALLEHIRITVDEFHTILLIELDRFW